MTYSTHHEIYGEDDAAMVTKRESVMLCELLCEHILLIEICGNRSPPTRVGGVRCNKGRALRVFADMMLVLCEGRDHQVCYPTHRIQLVDQNPPSKM